MIAALLVLLMVLLLACTLMITISLERHTAQILAALKSVGTPETPLSAQGGTFTQLLAAKTRAHPSDET